MRAVLGRLLILMMFGLLWGCAAHREGQLKPAGPQVADWGRYVPTDIATVMDRHIDHMDLSQSTRMNINARAIVEPYKVTAISGDRSRRISAERKELLKMWGKALGVDEGFIGKFEDEFLFEYDGRSFWFPVQGQLVPFLREEGRRGQRVDLLTMFVGTVWDSGQMEWVFIVNAFQVAD